MKHVVLILAHGDMNYLSALIDYFDDDFYLYIHLDKKSVFTDAEIDKISKKRNVAYLSCKYKINWGGYNLLRAELLLLEQAKKDDYADYFHFISGQDVPTVSIEEFKLFFERNNGKEFLEHDKLPRKQWDNGTLNRIEFYHFHDLFNHRTPKGRENFGKMLSFQKKFRLRRKLPTQFSELYGGSAWFSLSKEAVNYIVDFTTANPSFLKRLRYTFAPDEVYITTVLLNSSLKSKIVNNNLRYIEWKLRYNSVPAILDARDYYTILSSGVLFARKISFPISNQLINRLSKTTFFKYPSESI